MLGTKVVILCFVLPINLILLINKNGKTKIALTLGNIRTVQVTIIGARKSGRFNVSSLSNVLAVLAEAGGPYEIGSYREIELIRDNKVFKKIDLYDFMKN